MFPRQQLLKVGEHRRLGDNSLLMIAYLGFSSIKEETKIRMLYEKPLLTGYTVTHIFRNNNGNIHFLQLFLGSLVVS